MSNEYYIQDWVKIKGGKVYNAGKLVFESSETDFSIFLKSLYENLNLKYPKFHKMDGLSKLGILATEIISENNRISPETALVFANRASSLDTDRQFWASTASFASPSSFIYTLPNIVLGEISIRYKLQSENAFFIAERFNAQLLKDYTESLLELKKSSKVLCGWLDLENGEYDVFLCLVSSGKNIPFSEKSLKKIYFAENDKPTHGT